MFSGDELSLKTCEDKFDYLSEVNLVLTFFLNNLFSMKKKPSNNEIMKYYKSPLAYYHNLMEC